MSPTRIAASDVFELVGSDQRVQFLQLVANSVQHAEETSHPTLLFGLFCFASD